MERVMADKEIHHYAHGGGGSGIAAFLGAILGAVVVLGILYFAATNWDGGGGSKVSVNLPKASSPAAPAGAR